MLSLLFDKVILETGFGAEGGVCLIGLILPRSVIIIPP